MMNAIWGRILQRHRRRKRARCWLATTSHQRTSDPSSFSIFALDLRSPSSCIMHRLTRVAIYRPATAWNRAPGLRFTNWTEQCCRTLESVSFRGGSSKVLASLCRLQHVAEEARGLVSVNTADRSDHQNALLRKGLDMQMAELRQQVARNDELSNSRESSWSRITRNRVRKQTNTPRRSFGRHRNILHRDATPSAGVS
jgi:hypothetical protein